MSVRIVVLGLLLVPAMAGAQKIYTCKDASGKTMTSDRPIPECEKLPMRELRKDGSTLRVIDPPLTPAQRQAREDAEAKSRQDQIARDEQKRRDQALLATYSSEDSLQKARKRQITQIEDDIKLAQQRLQLAQKNLAGAQQEAKPFEKSRVPAGIQQKLMQGDAGVKAEQTVIESKRAEIDKVNQKFDQDLTRFRELTSARN